VVRPIAAGFRPAHAARAADRGVTLDPGGLPSGAHWRANSPPASAAATTKQAEPGEHGAEDDGSARLSDRVDLDRVRDEQARLTAWISPSLIGQRAKLAAVTWPLKLVSPSEHVLRIIERWWQ
jgi:hypothetical protein